MVRIVTLIAMIALSGCVVTNSEPIPAPPNPNGTLTEAERSACRADGGIVESAGLAGFERCTRSYSDAGKACTDSGQCEGECRTETFRAEPSGPVTGVCQADDNPFGCYETIENGRPGVAICVD